MLDNHLGLEAWQVSFTTIHWIRRFQNSRLKPFEHFFKFFTHCSEYRLAVNVKFGMAYQDLRVKSLIV